MLNLPVHCALRSRAFLMLSIAVMVLCCLTSSLASAQEAPTDQTVTVTGRVFDEQARPLDDIEVEAFAHKERPTTRSDPMGRFLFQISKEHRGSLALRAKTADGLRQGFHLIDKIDEPRQIAKLVMRSARTIEIIVIDGQQQPIEGASVAAMTYWYDTMAQAVSDGAGHAVLRLPADAGLQYVWAMKPDVGLDYIAFRRFDEPASNVYKLPPDHKQPLTLVLDGTRTVTVRVLDEQGKAVPGIVVYPWYFERPKKGDILNISGVKNFQVTTDAQSRAIFPFIPHDNQGAITFWTHPDGYYTPERPVFDPSGESSEIVARLVALVPVHGRVTHADGRPAANVEVLVSGDGYQLDRFHQSTRTAADGRFEVPVYPDQYYLFAADANRHATPPVARIVRQGQSPDDVHLVLQPATRVYGRLTGGQDHQPIADQYLTLYQNYAEQYQALPPDNRLPNPEASNKAVGPLLGRNAQTDAGGRFEFFAPPGHYYIVGPQTLEVPKFEITDQAELEVNLHTDRIDRVVLFGSVVFDSDRNQGVPEATVIGFAVDGRGALLHAVSDAEGAFEVERTPCEMLLHAMSRDKSLVGIARIGADDLSCEVPMMPVAAVRGKLIEPASGMPLADRQIDFRLQVQSAQVFVVYALQNIVSTNSEGEFEVNNLAAGWEYTLEVILERDRQGNPQRWKTAGAVTPKIGEVVDLGEIEFAPTDRSPTVTGKLTINGKPVAKGKLLFHPEKGKHVETDVNNGAFSTTNVPTGEMKVTFDFEGVPKKYQLVETTPLRVSITQGKNQLAFELKTD